MTSAKLMNIYIARAKQQLSLTYFHENDYVHAHVNGYARAHDHAHDHDCIPFHENAHALARHYGYGCGHDCGYCYCWH